MKKIFFGILFISMAVFAHPQEDYGSLFKDSTSDEGRKKEAMAYDENFKTKDFTFDISGSHFFYFHIPVNKDHFNFEGNIKAPKFRNELGIKIDYKQLKAAGNIQFDLLLNDWSAWYKVIRIRPLENYISWSPWKFTFSAGFQNYSWGLADGINPTDNINPRDYTAGVDAEKLSILSASVKFYPVNIFSLECIYVPFEQNDLFPKDVKSELSRELFYGRGIDLVNSNFLTNDIVTYAVRLDKNADYRQLDFNPANFVLGGKASFFLKSIDFSLSYLYDFDPYWTPEITLNKYQVVNSGTTVFVDPPGVNIPIPASYIYNVREITFVRNRIHRFGADIKGNIDRVGMWLELCYSMTEDYMLNDYKKRNHMLSWVTGFDLNAGPDDLFYINFQLMGEYVPLFDDRFYRDYKDGKPDSDKTDDRDYMTEYYYRALTDKLGSYNEGINLGFSVNLEWSIADDLVKPSITAAYSVPLIYDYDRFARYGGLYINPEIDFMPFDSFHVVLGADLYFAWMKEDSKIVSDSTYKTGNYEGDSNIFLQVKYKWDYEFKK